MNPPDAQNLTGKIALVTGASRGIGAAICRQLAASGAHVLLNYNRSADQAAGVIESIRSAGGQADSLCADVGDPAAVEAMFAEIDRDHGGKLDILVNNAGVFITGPLADYQPADFCRTFDVNVRGIFEVTRRAAPRLSRNGRIINIGSMLGERVLFTGASIYAASKFAVVGLTRGWAREFAPRGITVNVVEPGPIDTVMNPDSAENPMTPVLRAMTPLGRYGSVEELAAVVGFLASPQASFVTGAVINVDGGVLA